jgi:hypothetical protein
MPDGETTRRDRPPDPLGKRALFGVPSTADETAGDPGQAVPLPVGRRALYSGSALLSDSGVRVSSNPLSERGAFRIACQRCGQLSQIGIVDLVIFQLPIGVWLPGRRFDHRMTCPSCRRRAWCSVTLRRTAGVT